MNKELAKIFYALSYYLEMEDIPFKPNAYRKVGEILDYLEKDVLELYQEGGIEKLKEIPGIGKSIALQIEEYIKTGKVLMFEEYFKKIPIKLFDLLSINGLGPKTIYSLFINLGVKDVEDLKKVLKEEKIRTVPRLGIKMEVKLAKALNFHDKDKIEIPGEEELKTVDDEVGGLVRLSDICGDLHIHTTRESYSESIWMEEKKI